MLICGPLGNNPSPSHLSPVIAESFTLSPLSSSEPVLGPGRVPLPVLPVSAQFGGVDRVASAAYWRGEMSRARAAIEAEQSAYRLAELRYSEELGEMIAPSSEVPSRTSSRGRAASSKVRGKGKTTRK